MDRTMLLVSGEWEGQRSFKMIPISLECPYNEVIYDPVGGVLAIISKEFKENLKIVPQLNQFGKVKQEEGFGGSARQELKDRIQIQTYYEYFITDKEEIKGFVSRVAVNFLEFDIESLLK